MPPTSESTTSPSLAAGWRPPDVTVVYHLRNFTALLEAWEQHTRRIYVARHVAPPAKMLGVRCDSDVRIHFMLEGQRDLEAGFGATWRRSTFAPGDCWILPPYTFEREHRSGQFAFCALVIRPHVVRTLFSEIHPRRILVGNTPFAFHARPLPPARQREVEALQRLLVRRPGQTSLIRARLHRLVKTVVEHLQSESDTSAAPISSSYRTWQIAMDHVNRHIGQRITRESVADAIGVHRNYLSSLCKRVTGASFQNMVESARFARAKWMLENTDDKIALIAHRCGYRSPAYFGSVFRALSGMTPGAFRNSRHAVDPTATA